MIFARSPYFVEISGSTNDDTEVRLYIWNNPASAPTDPTYTLSKPIPSTLITSTTFNISPYLREYISHEIFDITLPNTFGGKAVNEWCNVKIETYVNGVLDTTTTTLAVDGYGYFSDSYNPDLGSILIDEGTYYYAYDSSYNPFSNDLQVAGEVTIRTGTSWIAKYTDLVNGATSTQALTDNTYKSIPALYSGLTGYMANGQKLEIIDGSAVVQATLYFRPEDVCKYTPVVCDFVNKYGSWQRTHFFKASRDTFEVENTEFNLMPESVDYSLTIGQRQVFNVTGKESISVNTGFVTENYKEVIRQIMLSEVILIDNKPAKLKTKSTQMFKHINEKLINYSMEFDYAYNYMNNVQ